MFLSGMVDQQSLANLSDGFKPLQFQFIQEISLSVCCVHPLLPHHTDDVLVHSVKRKVLNGSETSGQGRQHRLCN